MRIDLDRTVPVPAHTIYEYLRSPIDWVRLYGSFGDVRDVGDGWFRVPLRRFPFPLVARVTKDERDRHVAWELRGFFRGRGEVTFEPVPGGVRVTGFEEVRTPLSLLADALERLVLESRFRAIWESGFRRLARRAEGSSGRPRPPDVATSRRSPHPT